MILASDHNWPSKDASRKTDAFTQKASFDSANPVFSWGFLPVVVETSLLRGNFEIFENFKAGKCSSPSESDSIFAGVREWTNGRGEQTLDSDWVAFHCHPHQCAIVQCSKNAVFRARNLFCSSVNSVGTLRDDSAVKRSGKTALTNHISNSVPVRLSENPLVMVIGITKDPWEPIGTAVPNPAAQKDHMAASFVCHYRLQKAFCVSLKFRKQHAHITRKTLKPLCRDESNRISL